MYHAIGNQDIRHDNPRTIHEHIASNDGNVHVLSIRGGQRAVHQGARIANRARDNVVPEDIAKVFSAELTNQRTNGGEGIVGGSEDRDVLHHVRAAAEVGLCKSPSDGGKVGAGGSGGQILGDAQHRINDMNDAAGEGNVLYELVSCFYVQSYIWLGASPLASPKTSLAPRCKC